MTGLWHKTQDGAHGLWRKTHDGVQNLLYKLGPTYCILLGALFLFGSFLVQLLTSIGVPFIKAFYFFRFDLSNFTFIELGMWAACYGKEALTFRTRPDLNQQEQFTCPPPTWGWTNLQFSGITQNFFDRNLPKALIFHPISCGFTLFALCAALITIRRQRSHFVLPIFSFLSCLFALISFFIDVATFVPAKGKLMSPKGTSVLGLVVESTELGPAFWLSLACFCLDIVGNSIIIFGYGIWRYQRTSISQRRRSGAYSMDLESKGVDSNRRGYRSQPSTTSFGDAATSTSKSSQQGRRGVNEDEYEEEEEIEMSSQEKNSASHTEQEEIETLRNTSAPPLRLSGDGGRSTTDVASFAPTQYEDAEEEEDEDEDDDQSNRSIYEDAPQNVGSRGFSKRKPVQQY